MAICPMQCILKAPLISLCVLHLFQPHLGYSLSDSLHIVLCLYLAASCRGVSACDSQTCIAVLCLQAALITHLVLFLLAMLSGQGFDNVYFLTLTG